ncbi:alpha-(1,6)-fucosyltransferase-like, partial [Ixodes scapularis]
MTASRKKLYWDTLEVLLPAPLYRTVSAPQSASGLFKQVRKLPVQATSKDFFVRLHLRAPAGGTCESRCLESGVSTDPEPCGFARPRLAVRGFPVSGEKGILVVEPSPGAAPKLFCPLVNKCGLASGVHNLLWCLVAALRSGRTLVVDTSEWHYAPQNKWVKTFLPILGPSCADANTRNTTKNPIPGGNRVHIRRSDKYLEAVYHDVQEYMVHVEDYYAKLSLTTHVEKKRVFVATDELRVVNEIRE